MAAFFVHARAQSSDLGTRVQSTQGALPKVFSGWEQQGVSSADVAAELKQHPAFADFGLASAADAEYARDGEKLHLHVLSFKDATGAFAAFTHLRTPQMSSAEICDRAATTSVHVVFECSGIVVEATVPHVTAMTAAEMRDLAGQLPKLSGAVNQQPSLYQFVPKELQSSGKYSSGVASWQAAGAPVPADVAGIGNYRPESLISAVSGDNGEGTAAVIEYPTPKIAQAEIQRMGEWRKAQIAGSTLDAKHTAASAKPGGTFEVRRSGPLVAIVSGTVRDDAAKMLVERVHYEAQVTWNEQTSLAPKNNIGNLVYNILLLGFIIGIFGIFIGVVFGGFRIAARKMFPGKIIDRPQENEFIRLNIDE